MKYVYLLWERQHHTRVMSVYADEMTATTDLRICTQGDERQAAENEDHIRCTYWITLAPWVES